MILNEFDLNLLKFPISSFFDIRKNYITIKVSWWEGWELRWGSQGWWRRWRFLTEARSSPASGRDLASKARSWHTRGRILSSRPSLRPRVERGCGRLCCETSSCREQHRAASCWWWGCGCSEAWGWPPLDLYDMETSRSASPVIIIRSDPFVIKSWSSNVLSVHELAAHKNIIAVLIRLLSSLTWWLELLGWRGSLRRKDWVAPAASPAISPVTVPAAPSSVMFRWRCEAASWKKDF